MTLYVFTGPTISAEDAARELDAIYLPPAAQGDVYRAALEKPRAIGLIDGYFDQVASVTHKEILWAMAQGVHVFGSASMGALRAAELAAFGMEGVGAVFEALRSGELEDDDEVAVAHGSREHGYRVMSEAMVNIRSTLAAAAAAAVISAATRGALERTAKDLFYPDRCYPIVLSRAAEQGLPAGELAALEAYLRESRVNQKRDDAIAMLRVMRERFAASGHVEPKRVRFSFEHTDAWEEVRQRAGRRAIEPDPNLAEASAAAAVLEELRASGSGAAARLGATVRAIAIEHARASGRGASGAAARDAAEAFRRERGLLDPADFQRWLAEHDVRDAQRFFEDEAHVRRLEATIAADVERALPDHLRAMGEYGPLLARARDKQRSLARPIRSSGDRPDAQPAVIGERAPVLDHLDARVPQLQGDRVVPDPELEPDEARPRRHGQDLFEVIGERRARAEDVDDIDGRADVGQARAHRLAPERGAGEPGVHREDPVSLPVQVIGHIKRGP
jgi:hypothetical protein